MAGEEPARSSRPVEPNRFFATVLADQHYQKGADFERQGYWERALQSYRRACALDPGNALFLLARGHVCQTHGLEPEAEECYAVALRLRPGHTVALYNQAQLFAARGQLEEARANLVKIVAGGVESLGDRAAPIFCRLGEIALRREDYAAAGIHFRRALEAAPANAYAAAALRGLERFMEFAAPFGADGRVAPKVAVYGYAGAVLLGLPGDDGVDVPPSPGLGFDSLDEVAETLGRFVTLARRYCWSVSSVVALDAESQPLAIALATALGVRSAHAPEAAPRGAPAIGVTASGADPAAVRAQLAALRQRCPRSLFYAVGLTHPIWEYAPAVQVVTAPVRLEFPWSRGEASTPEHAEAFGAELAERLKARPVDPTVEAQAVWYAAHPRLGFDLETLAVEAEEDDQLPAVAGQEVRAGGTPLDVLGLA